MKKDNKLKYEAPSLEVIHVEMEQGIAAASATVSGGDSDTPYQPEVDDWQVGSEFDSRQDGDL